MNNGKDFHSSLARLFLGMQIEWNQGDDYGTY